MPSLSPLPPPPPSMSGGRPASPSGASHATAAAASPASAPATTRLLRRARSAWTRLPPTQRVMTAALALLLVVALAAVAVAASHRLFGWLTPFAQAWRRQRLLGGLVVFVLVFVTAFPPLIGYSTAATLAGFVFGFPAGWPVASAAAVAGSLAAFAATRSVLGRWVRHRVGKDARFQALAHVLRRDGLLVLTAIRFCPLPFSLSNGFLATVPTITPGAFVIATALSNPKLLIHIFIGSRLAVLAEKGDSMTINDKIVNYLGILVGAAVGLLAGLAVYRRTMARAAQLTREDAVASASGPVHDDHDDDATLLAEQGHPGYHDLDMPLLDPDDASAAMLDHHLLPNEGPNPAPSATPPPLVDRYRDQDGNTKAGQTRQ